MFIGHKSTNLSKLQGKNIIIINFNLRVTPRNAQRLVTLGLCTSGRAHETIEIPEIKFGLVVCKANAVATVLVAPVLVQGKIRKKLCS